MSAATSSPKGTAINCKGCGLAIEAKRNGRTTIWLEASGRKHNCPNAGNFASGEVQAAEHEANSLEAIYEALKELDGEKPAAPKGPKKKLPSQHVNGDVPVKDRSYLIDSYHLKVIQAVIADADEGEPQNMGFWGPAGSGKSSLGLQIGALRGSPTWVIDSTDKQTADEWFGTQTIHNGELVTNVSDFVKAIETANAVVVLDDVALLQSKTVQSGLNAVLDPTRRSIFVQSLGRDIVVAEGVVIVGTWNVGDEYVAERLSAQIVDRFRSGCMFEVLPLDNGAMERMLVERTGVSKQAAEQLVRGQAWLMGDKANPVTVTSRGLLSAAFKVLRGLSYGEAFGVTIFSDMDVQDRTKAYQVLANGAAKAATLKSPSNPEDWTTPVQGAKMVKLP